MTVGSTVSIVARLPDPIGQPEAWTSDVSVDQLSVPDGGDTTSAQTVVTEDSAISGPERTTTAKNEPAIGAMPEPDDIGIPLVDVTLGQVRGYALANSEVTRQLGVRIVQTPQAAATRHDPEISSSDPIFGIDAALSEFDTVLSGSAWYNKFDRVFNNVTLGGGATELLQDLVTVEAQASKTTPHGTRFSMRRTTLYDDNNRLGNLFRNSWETYWEAEIRQPLLQGAGRAFNEIAGPRASPGFQSTSGVLLAQTNRDISELDFQIAVRDFISQVDDAYWQLFLAYREYVARVRTRDAMEQTWQLVQSKTAEDLPGGEAYREAQAREDYYRYVDLVSESLNGSDRVIGLKEANLQLRRLIGWSADPDQLFRPVESMSPADNELPFSALHDLARQHRCELQRQQIRIEQQQLRVSASQHFVRPRLDAVARYRLRGFGDDFSGGSTRFSSALSDLSSFDHQEWELGMEMQVPVGRRRARAGVRHEMLKLAREQAVLREQDHQIAHEVRIAFGRVEQTMASAEAAKMRLDAAQQRVESSVVAFQTGQLPLDLLLDAQERLYDSERRFHEVLAQHAIAHKNVRYHAGILLRDCGVTFAR